MDRAAQQLGAARDAQIGAWKSELSAELDRSIQEMVQLSREQQALEQRARQGEGAESLRSEQSALQQGAQKAGSRLSEAGKKSSLLSQRSQRSVSEAQQKVGQASQSLQGQQSGQGGQSGQSGGQTADAMRDASEALNQAALSLVRDRERVNGASSASGFSEMLEAMKQLAQQQGSLNGQASSLFPNMNGQPSAQQQAQMRSLAKQQRGVAQSLEELGDGDPTGKADALAKEARQLAQALERAQADPSTLQRQQQLYRRLLDAGRTMEQDERDDTGKREAKAGNQSNAFAPAGADAKGAAARRYQPPNWNDLRGLSAEERRLVLEYFKRINGTP
jgi:cell division protein FtsB